MLSGFLPGAFFLPVNFTEKCCHFAWDKCKRNKKQLSLRLTISVHEHTLNELSSLN